jgi:hypothetical protein
MGREEAPAVRLLTRLFVRRLLDNDLISPHADRHESLAVLYAVVVSLAVFVTFFVSTPYLSAFIQLPGPTALSAVSDRFLFVSASMAVCALAALLVWDALALEPRDAAILGPLPIPSWAITCAKLAAALVFGAVFSMAVNAVPSVLYPAFLTLNLRGISGAGIVRLMAAQAMTVIMAGLCGFFAVFLLRGVLRLTLGERGFRRISGVAQSVFVVCSVSALILTPTIGATAVRDWVAGVVPPRWPAVPVLWHLGVSETTAGDVVVDTPVVMPPRLTLTASLQRQDEEGRSTYRALRPSFEALARTAWLVLPFVTILSVVTFLWNNRRLPDQSAGRPALSRPRATVRTIAEQLTRGNPEAQAGFFFTLQTLTRSGPHRTIVAVSVAGALTLPFITLVGGGTYSPVSIASTPLGFFGIEIMVLSSLIAGFRYAVAVPAELAANWTIRVAWLGDERGYLEGVKRAAIMLAVILPLLVLLPLHVAHLGLVRAVVHSLFGFLFAVAALDVMFLGYRKVPFACSYLPVRDPKLLWSGGTAILLLVPYAFAYVERSALQSPSRAVALGAVLGGIVLALRIVDRAQRRERLPVIFDEAPAPATQRLGLFERMAIHD